MSSLEIDGIAINKMRVVDLKNALDERGLSKAGKKDELVARLAAFIEEEGSEAEKESSKDSEDPENILGEKGKVDVVGKSDQDIQQQEIEKEKEADRKLAEEIAAKQREEEEEKKRAALELKRKLDEDALKAEKEKREEDKRKKAEEDEILRKEKEEQEKTEEEQKNKEAEIKRREKRKEELLREKEAEIKKKEERRIEEEKETEKKTKEEEKAAEKKRKEEEKRNEEKESKEKQEAGLKKKEEQMKAEENEKRAEIEEAEKVEKRRKEAVRERELREKERADEIKKKESKKLKEQEREDKSEENDKDKRKKDKRDSSDREETLKMEQEMLEEEKRKLEEEEAAVKLEKEKLEKERRAREEKSNSSETNAEGGTGENVTDDTLVMEVDQHDMVADDPSKEESDDKLISAEPGEVTSFRKLGGSKTSSENKRGWGASRTNRNQSSENVEISSNSLKDLVPDLKPLMSVEAKLDETEEDIQTIDSDADVAGPKIPAKVKNESGEPVKKRKKIVLDTNEETNFILIVHLTRPFTVNQLKEMLKRTGTIEDFWIDRIKSKCCVKFTTKDQASETKMALDGVTWPQGSPKTLRVSFSTEKDMENFKEGNDEGNGRMLDVGGRNGGIREWDRVKLEQDREKQREREVVRVRRDSRDKEKEEKENRGGSEEKKVNTKCLEELFNKTTAIPALYWKPLTEDDRKKKEEDRNKKAVEAQILKDMMDTKESLQRSKRLVPERRKSRSSSGSSR